MFDNPVSAMTRNARSTAGDGDPVGAAGREPRIGDAGVPHLHGRLRVVLGRGFARDTVVVRVGGLEFGRRCGVTTLPSGIGGTIVGEVPVGSCTSRVEVEVVGRRLRASMQLVAPSSGDVTVEARLIDAQLELRAA